VAKEGFTSLYAGLSAGLTRQAFYATSRLGLFEVMRDEIAKYRETDVFTRLFAGCISGGVAAMISSPAEVTLIRLANDASLPAAERRNYTGLPNAAMRIMAEEGPAAFYRGSVTMAQRAMLVGACQVGTYDQFKATYRSLGVTDVFQNVFCAAMSSGLLYSLVTMPFESAKNRLAFQKPLADGTLQYTSTFQTIRGVASSEGFLTLYNGFGPYYLRCGGHTVLMFIFVENMRRAIAASS